MTMTFSLIFKVQFIVQNTYDTPVSSAEEDLSSQSEAVECSGSGDGKQGRSDSRRSSASSEQTEQKHMADSSLLTAASSTSDFPIKPKPEAVGDVNVEVIDIASDEDEIEQAPNSSTSCSISGSQKPSKAEGSVNSNIIRTSEKSPKRGSPSPPLFWDVDVSKIEFLFTKCDFEIHSIFF
jgi:hypothetical protein